MIKINNKLTVDHELSDFLLKDPISATLLWYFILDYPGEEGSIVSVQELANKLNYTRRIVQKRIDYLEKYGLINSYTSEFYGGQRLPSAYKINFESPFFIKQPKRKETLIEESPDVDEMISLFTSINKEVHGKEYKPTAKSQRSKWVKGANRILNLKVDGEEFSMDSYKRTIRYLANQTKDWMDGNQYAMRASDLGNVAYTDPRQTECKYVKACRKSAAEDFSHITEIISDEEENQNDRGEYKTDSGGTHVDLWAPL